MEDRIVFKSNNSQYSKDKILISEGGGKYSVDLNMVKERLTRLKENYEMNINDLDGILRQDYLEMVNYIKTLYETNVYNVLFDEIKKVFGELKNVNPGTVGNYFTGCLIKNNLPEEIKSCSLNCITSVPLPKQLNSVVNKCNYFVIWCIRDEKQIKLIPLNDPKPEAIVYVNHNNPMDFKGFSEMEKEAFKSGKVERINVIGYNENNGDYIELLGGFVSIEEIPVDDSIVSTNNSTNVSAINNSNSNNSNVILMGLIILVVIFILLYFSGR